MNLVVKYPTRGRARLFCDTLNTWVKMLSGRHHVRFVVSIDEDDSQMNSAVMHGILNRQRNLEWHVGKSKTKIAAVNADFDKLGDYDVLVLASDDMRPVVRGYDEVIARNMKRVFPDNDGCLHFSDGFNTNGLNTLPIVGKKLLDEWGYIYHPAYISEFCDNEMMEVTERDGISEKIDQCIIKHEWTKLTGTDATFRKNSGFHQIDHQTFVKRKAAGFPKEWPVK